MFRFEMFHDLFGLFVKRNDDCLYDQMKKQFVFERIISVMLEHLTDRQNLTLAHHPM